MKVQNLDEITDTAYRKIGFVILIAGILYFLLYNVIKPSHIYPVWQISILGYILATGIICFLTKPYKKLRKLADHLVIIATSIMVCEVHISTTVSIIIPIILSLYSLNKKYIEYIIVITALFVCISIICRQQFIQAFLITGITTGKKDIIKDSVISIIAFLVELKIIQSLYKPFHTYSRLIGEERTALLNEKNSAIENVLSFCNTAMAYHSKYLLIHNKSVEALTQIILVGLYKKEEYKNYLTPQKCKDILASVQFHDIGKIYIDASVLDKPDRLTKEEYDLVKQHPEKGYELFNQLPLNVTTPEFRATCGKIILEHHERLDGTGYPYHKKDISLEGQIVAVADVTDALLSWRCYKSPFSWDKFVSILKNDKGLNQEFCNIIIKNKKEVINMIDHNNLLLKDLFKLSQNDIIRH